MEQNINVSLVQLVNYARERGLIGTSDRAWAVNQLLDVLGLDWFEDPGQVPQASLEDILCAILDWAAAQGRIDGGPASRDLLDTALMGRLTPKPSDVISRFQDLRELSGAQDATDWFYQLCQDTDYIRAYRVKKDMKWVAATPYGNMDITINLSKPEKDPKAIAAAKNAPQNAYPKCQLCRENEGYAGRLDHPARANHRVIPVTLDGQQWFFQYSPYVYYNEHCIVFNGAHVPMKIDTGTFRRALDFVAQFPHYFVGSNADLPIVGGSILSHDHFQGGSCTFAMERAPIDTPVTFPGSGSVKAGIVRWPMSVLRLRSRSPFLLTDLADRILTAWRSWSDPAVGIYAETDGEPHNTITPIARRRGDDFELDLVLRNNLTTPEHPLGVFHPHQDLHHIKKENIGLIEVMGLAVLPARLKDELTKLAFHLVGGTDPSGDSDLVKHGDWVRELRARHSFTQQNVWPILQDEVGRVFTRVLEDAGVFKRDTAGQAAFLRFVDSVK